VVPPEQFVAAGEPHSTHLLARTAVCPGDRPTSATERRARHPDISDIERPTLVSRLEIGAAFSSMIALHTVIPLPSRIS